MATAEKKLHPIFECSAAQDLYSHEKNSQIWTSEGFIFVWCLVISANIDKSLDMIFIGRSSLISTLNNLKHYDKNNFSEVICPR